jgi:hypothetical protein
MLALLVLLAVAKGENMVRVDSRANLENFYTIAQKDFSIDKASTVASEKKAYDTLKSADTDKNGKITYTEYLTYQNKVTPDSISPFDFALSKLLPTLKDFVFSEDGGSIGEATLSTSFEVTKGIVLPANSKITIINGALLVNPANNFVVKVPNIANELPLKGGKDSRALVVLPFEDEKGFFLLGGQLSKDTDINGIPCKATIGDKGGVSFAIFPSTGNVQYTYLAKPYTTKAEGVQFFPEEKVEFDENGSLKGAHILETRDILGKEAIATGDAQSWAANVTFEEGKVAWCYQGSFKFLGNSVKLYAAVHYNAAGSVDAVMTTGGSQRIGDMHFKAEAEMGAIDFFSEELTPSIRISGNQVVYIDADTGKEKKIEISTIYPPEKKVLTEKYTDGGTVFLPGESIWTDFDGHVVSAHINTSRTIAGKEVAAYQYENGANQEIPNITFVAGQVEWCYQSNLQLWGLTFDGVHGYKYSADMPTPREIHFTSDSELMGFPVMKAELTGNPVSPWSSSVIFDYERGFARLKLSRALTVGNGKEKISVPEGSFVEIFMGGVTIAAIETPDKKIRSFKKEDKMMAILK